MIIEELADGLASGHSLVFLLIVQEPNEPLPVVLFYILWIFLPGLLF